MWISLSSAAAALASVCCAAVECVCWWLAGYGLCSAVQCAHSWFYFHSSQWRSVCVWNNPVTRLHQYIHVQPHALPRSSSASMQGRKNLIKDHLSGRKWRSLITPNSSKSGLPFRRITLICCAGWRRLRTTCRLSFNLRDVWEKDGLQKASTEVTGTTDPHTHTVQALMPTWTAGPGGARHNSHDSEAFMIREWALQMPHTESWECVCGCTTEAVSNSLFAKHALYDRAHRIPTMQCVWRLFPVWWIKPR